MESKHVLLACTIVLILCLATSDIDKDKEKCQNQLISLATCLPYVGGEAKSPTSDCCTGFKQVLRDSLPCVCILVKDRNDPSLGLKINATLALSLPARCNAPLDHSVSDCPSILHLPPNSPDAKIFDDFAKSAGKSNSTAAPATATTTTTGSSSPSKADEKSDGGMKERWLETQLISGLLIVMVAVQIFNIQN